jgi:hypothetical protein
MANVTLPTTTGFVDQRIFASPLGGPEHPVSYLARFPDEVYTKSPDSHLVKFMYTLMGPSGAGWIRKNYLEARLKLEDFGLELFDLDAFFGNPFQFARIFNEVYDQDPNGLLPREDWDRIRNKDAQYRNRALDFITGVRLGNTPKGMEFIARAGLGHEVEIIENYKALYDQHSDDPLGHVYYGKTASTEEMIVLPRRQVTTSEIQTITISGGPTGGTFRIYYNGEITGHISFDATAFTIREFLETLNGIASGDVEVYGGPGPSEPWVIQFTGRLATQDVAQMSTENYLTGGAGPSLSTRTTQAGTSATDEIAFIPAREQYHLQQALDRIKPVTTIPTFGSAPGLADHQVWNKAFATSEYDEVIRYVVGSTQITWPQRNGFFWIESGIERESVRAKDARTYHYQGWHKPTNVIAYDDGLLDEPTYDTGTWTEDTFVQHRAEHIGAFSALQKLVIPFLGEQNDVDRYTADRSLADYPEPLSVRSVTKEGRQLINSIYPIEYAGLPGVPQIKYRDEQFWASREREEGIDYLEIDLGELQAVNYLSFEITRKPVTITVEHDLLDRGQTRRWNPVTFLDYGSTDTIQTFNPEDQSPWNHITMSFTNSLKQLIFTRHIRLGFERRSDLNSPFSNPEGTVKYPWSVEVRNLRIGRNVSN